MKNTAISKESQTSGDYLTSVAECKPRPKVFSESVSLQFFWSADLHLCIRFCKVSLASVLVQINLIMFIENSENPQLVQLTDASLQYVNGGMGYHEGAMENAALFNCFIAGFWDAMH